MSEAFDGQNIASTLLSGPFLWINLHGDRMIELSTLTLLCLGQQTVVDALFLKEKYI